MSRTRENSRLYVVDRKDLPKDVMRRLEIWLRKYNCQLAGLLEAHGLGGESLSNLPWLAKQMQGERGTAFTDCAGLAINSRR